MRKWTRAAVLAGWVGMVCSALAQGDQIIYDNSLENGWQDWGWAKHNYGNTSPVHSGADSVSVTCTNGDYQALYIEHTAFDSSPYTNLVFWINGGAAGGQKVGVCAHMNGNNTAWYTLHPLPANTWTNVVLPLSAIGAANAGALDGLWFGDDGANGATFTFYLDDIELQAGAP